MRYLVLLLIFGCATKPEIGVLKNPDDLTMNHLKIGKVLLNNSIYKKANNICLKDTDKYYDYALVNSDMKEEFCECTLLEISGFTRDFELPSTDLLNLMDDIQKKYALTTEQMANEFAHKASKKYNTTIEAYLYSNKRALSSMDFADRRGEMAYYNAVVEGCYSQVFYKDKYREVIMNTPVYLKDEWAKNDSALEYYDRCKLREKALKEMGQVVEAENTRRQCEYDKQIWLQNVTERRIKAKGK